MPRVETGVRLALLAPIPGVHVHSALETCEREGRVAFGSNASIILTELQQYGDIPVYVYVSTTGGELSYHKAGRVTLEAIFSKVQERTVNGRHPDPKLRPISTIEGARPDTSWRFFWEVRKLKVLDLARPLTTFASLKSGKVLSSSFVPKGLLLVNEALGANKGKLAC